MPNSAYTLYSMAYHTSLSAGYYLECHQAGTTSNSDITFPSMHINTPIIDGTVIWKLRTIQGTEFYPYGDKKIPENSDLNNYITPGTYVCESGYTANTLLNCPYSRSNFRLNVVRNTHYNNQKWWGYQILIGGFIPEGESIFIRGHEGEADIWGNWKEITGRPIFIDENIHIDDLNTQNIYFWNESRPQGLPDYERYGMSQRGQQWGTLKVESMGVDGYGQNNPIKQTIDFNIYNAIRFSRYKTGAPLIWGTWRVEFTNQSCQNSLSYASNVYKFNINHASRWQTLLILTEYDLYIVKLHSSSETDITAEVKCLGGFSSTPITCTARVIDVIQESLPNRNPDWFGTLELTFSETMNGIKILGNVEV